MKKWFFCLLAMLTAASLFTAAGADGLVISEQNLITYEGENQGYFLAKVMNTGTHAVYVGSGMLEVYDAADELIFSDDWVRTSPSGIWLEPGEDAYIYKYIWENALLERPADHYAFSISDKEWGYKYHTISCQSELYYDGYDNYDNCFFVTFTNESDKLLHDFTVQAALYDSSDQIVFVRSDQFDEIGIHPWCTVTIQIPLDNSIAKYLETNKLGFGAIDARVYVSDED